MQDTGSASSASSAPLPQTSSAAPPPPPLCPAHTDTSCASVVLQAPRGHRSVGSRFGAAVALGGNFALVGAPGTTGGGAAFIFQVAPTLEADAQTRLVPPAVAGVSSCLRAEADCFGSAVALSSSGEYAAVGAPDAYVGGATTRGAVYVFRYAAGAWVYHSVLTSALENERFGWSVSIDKYATGGSGDTGRVRVVVGCQCRSGEAAAAAEASLRAASKAATARAAATATPSIPMRAAAAAAEAAAYAAEAAAAAASEREAAGFVEVWEYQEPLRWVVRGQALLDHFGGGGGDPRLHASVNWMSSSGDILFHFNTRPGWRRIYFDTRINGVWVGDQTLPLVGDLSVLQWTVMVDDAGFHVIDRGSEVLVRPHRAPWSSFTACQYTNGVTLLPVGNDGLPVPATTHNWALVWSGGSLALPSPLSQTPLRYAANGLDGFGIRVFWNGEWANIHAPCSTCSLRLAVSVAQEGVYQAAGVPSDGDRRGAVYVRKAAAGGSYDPLGYVVEQDTTPADLFGRYLKP